MHNRLRMVVASFLVKELGLDWRRGEAYFEAKLNDFDLAAQQRRIVVGRLDGLRRAAWFRIFNPATQSEKFDGNGKFFRHYVPEIAKLPDRSIHAPWLAKPETLQSAGISLGSDHPMPIVDHAARKRTLLRFDVVKDRRPTPRARKKTRKAGRRSASLGTDDVAQVTQAGSFTNSATLNGVIVQKYANSIACGNAAKISVLLDPMRRHHLFG
jgi:hypothetical protein